MPSDNVMSHFIDKINAPELVFTIGIVAIAAYVAVKFIPMMKELRLKKIENDAAIKMKELEIEEAREKRKAEEAMREDERDRARTEVIGKQNEIQESLVRSLDGQAIQMAGLISSLDESKMRSRDMGETVNDTNIRVREIHTMIMNGKKAS